VLGAEWVHNLAHTAAAQQVGKPPDAIRLAWGLPLLVYHNVSDASVSPRQHLWRTLGGPLFNSLLVPFLWLLRRRTQPGTPAAEVASAALYTNTFIGLVALTPLPFLDGGPLLRWSLVARGHSLAQADSAVQAANRLAGAGFSMVTAAALRRRRWLLAALLVQFAAWCFAYGFG
jgi:hypothetical protein